MLWFLKNRTYSSRPILRLISRCGPIGLSIRDDTLKMAQLEINGKAINLIAGDSKNRPEDVEPGSANWQRWAVDTIRELIANGKFRGRDAVAAIPANGLFIDHIEMPTSLRNKSQTGAPAQKVNYIKLADALFPKMKQRLPFEPDAAMIRYIPMEDNVLVIAAERKVIDRHLAIYEKAGLVIKSIGVWPVALANSYAGFFGRRKVDIEAIVMLLDIEPSCTNVAICRHKNLLFARSIPIGSKHLDGEKITGATSHNSSSQATQEGQGASRSASPVMKLVLELIGCRHRFASMYKEAQIERLVFLSGQSIDRDIGAIIAKKLEMPAQMGDCLAAVQIPTYRRHPGIDRRVPLSVETALQKQGQLNWATTFGLSLS